MYLSQLTLNRTDRQAMRTLSDVYRLHQFVMSGFSDYDHPRVLFRIEPELRGNVVKLLVQSKLKPVWNAKKVAMEVEMKEFTPRFSKGGTFRFRLRANPVVTREGKRLGLIRDEALVNWLSKKGDGMGASFQSIRAIDEGYVTGSRRKGEKVDKINIKIARFEGVLEIVDPSNFSEAFDIGVGHAKGFGCGLLSLARL